MSTMRRSWLAAVALSGLCCTSAGVALARDPLMFDSANDLQSYDQVKSQLDKIPPYLSDAMCGGWNGDVSVEGKIAKVTGVPGHKGDWKGAIDTGMAKR